MNRCFSSTQHPQKWRKRLLAGGVLAVSLFVPFFSNAAPQIISPPQSQIIVPGSSAVLNVTVVGTPPIFYQWQKSGTNLPSQTNASLVFNNIQTVNEGGYAVIVSDATGSVTSRVATLGSVLAIQWQQTFGGFSDDRLYNLQETSDGGFIFGGYSGSGVSGNKTTPNAGNNDFWIIKVDDDGAKQWERSFGGESFDELSALQQTPDGGFILGGISDSPVSGNKTNEGFGTFDYWIVKLDENGNKQWEQSFGGTNSDFFAALQQTGDGGYILGGYSDSAASGNKTNAGFGDFDYWVVRINSAGAKLWEKTFGGSGDDWLNTLQKTSDGGYILGGYSISPASGNKTNAGSGGYEYWAVKIDSNGNKVWEKSISDIDNDDYCVSRLDANGQLLWDKCAGGTSADILCSIHPISYGGYVLGGYSFSEPSGNKSSDAYGNGDYWIVGVDSVGDKLWEKAVGGNNMDVLRNLRQTSDGGYILGGYSSSDISGNKTSAAFGSFDYWVVKLVITTPPEILVHPQTRTNPLGSPVTFSVVANNAFGYQWRLNGNDIYGATDSDYTIDSLQMENLGRYDVIVRPGAYSSNAYLFVSTAETNRPTISILAPKSNQRLTNEFSFNMTGTAKDTGVGVGQVFYSVNGGPFELANGTTGWLAPLALVPGTNRVAVKAIDFAGIESDLLARSFFNASASWFYLSTSGDGTVLSTTSAYGTPTNLALLEVGRGYEVKAIPGPNQVFSNWTGSVTYTNAAFDFLMQPNMILTANFVPNPLLTAAGSYNGLFYQTNPTHRTAGFFFIKVRTNFAFSGRVVLDGDSIAMSGKFNVDGTLTKQISRAKLGLPDLTLTVALDFANGTDRATGTVSSDNWVSTLQAERAAFSSLNPATNFTNTSTVLIPGFSNSAIGPPGYGYGLVKVKPNGSVVLTGETADGIKTSQSVALSKDGRWPLYVSLYKGTRNYTNWITQVPATDTAFYFGSTYGWVAFDQNIPNGQIRLVKTKWTNSVYPGGFTNETALIGARYVPPVYGTAAMDMTDGTITFTHGNLPVPVSGSSVLIKPSNAAAVTNDHGIKFTLGPRSGLISGSFQNPTNPNVLTTFKGAILQDQKIGAGHFTGTNRGGLFLLEEN